MALRALSVSAACAVVLLAACGNPQGDEDETPVATATAPPTATIPATEPGEPPEGAPAAPESGTIPVEGDGVPFEQALGEAASRAGFAALHPTYLPTAADQVRAVFWREAWPDIPGSGQSTREYVSEATTEVDGREQPGELLPDSVEGLEVYEELPEGFPDSVGYYVHDGDATIIFTFEVGRPLLAEVEQMLTSLEPVEPA